ncbi:MAG: BMP family ABC transporter substrate-binding protein [Syntrophothermus sp.]
MLKRRRLVVWLVVVVAFMLAAATGLPAIAGAKTGAGAQEKLKVAFIYVGPVGDAGWTYAHDLGRKYLEKQLPYVETTFVESVPEGADSERVLTELAQKGNKVIFATSFGYMDAVINVAKKFPNVVFEHCSGYKTAANVGTYFGRIEEPRYLSGMVAGKMTKKNLIGYVAAHPIPEVIRGINAFTLGVLAVNPRAKVKVVWTNTWYDPASEKEAAKSLLDVGADVIAQHQDTPAPQQAAQEKGAFGIGYNSDMSGFAPKAVLTAPVWDWGPFYVDVVKRVKEGTWKSSQFWGSMAEKTVGLAPMGSMVPEDVKALVKKKQDQIMAGKFTIFDIFQGPLKDQKGEIRVPAGKKMTGEEILGMSWFVQGVEGTIPK